MSQLSTSKLVRLLGTFSSEEIKSFLLWLKSPWANSNKNLIRLLEQLRKFHPSFELGRLDKESLFRKVIPHGTYSARSMNNLLSEAFLSAERFLVFERVANEKNLQERLLAEELQKRQLTDWFSKKVGASIEKLEKQPVKAWEDYLDLFLLYRMVNFHPSQSGNYKIPANVLDLMQQTLDLVFLLETGSIINEKIFRSRIKRHEEYQIDHSMGIWKALKASYDHPSLHFFMDRFSYDEEAFLEQFFQLRDQFVEKFNKLNLRDQKIHLQSLFNDGSLLTRSGQIGISELLPLYQLGLERQLLQQDGILPPTIFATVVSASNTASSFKYTLDFINEFAEELPINLRTEARSWGLAHTAYWEKNYDKCLAILLAQPVKSLYFNLLTRVLNTQVYFDLFLQDSSYGDFLFNFFDAFEKWLQREKHRAKFNKSSFLRFIQLSRSLARLYMKADFDDKSVSALLKNEDNVQASNWLRQKQALVIQLRKGTARPERFH